MNIVLIFPRSESEGLFLKMRTDLTPLIASFSSPNQSQNKSNDLVMVGTVYNLCDGCSFHHYKYNYISTFIYHQQLQWRVATSKGSGPVWIESIRMLWYAFNSCFYQGSNQPVFVFWSLLFLVCLVCNKIRVKRSDLY